MIKDRSSNFYVVVFAASMLIAVLFGGRNSLSLVIQGINESDNLNYLQISFAFALGQIVVGIISPFSGMMADRYGSGKTLFLGVILTLIGCALIPYATNPITLSISLGAVASIGLGVAGLPVIMASVNKLVPKDKVGIAFGLVNAGQSLGQLVIAPLAGFVIVSFGWIASIYMLCLMLLLVLPLSLILKSKDEKNVTFESSNDMKMSETLSMAFKTPSYIYLISGFFVCGFHVTFIATHMPGVIEVCGLSPAVSGWSLGVIGLFNIVGSVFAGWYISLYSMRIFLAYMYFARCVIVLLFLVSPMDIFSVMIFSIALGFTYFSVIPATAGLIGKMFGPKFMATLFGFALFSHSIGGFLGAYLGGYFFTLNGDYTMIWLLDAMLAVFAALIHLPIKERAFYKEMPST